MSNRLQFTSVAAVLTFLAVLLLCGFATATGQVTFTDPSTRLRAASEFTRPIQVVEQTVQPSADVPEGMTDHLKTVFMVGREVGNPETLQAILMQETNGGRSERIGNKNAPIGKRSYGLMQVQVVAARSVLERFPVLLDKYFEGRKYGSLMDEEIIALLLSNDEANVRIAAYHFKLYMQLSGGDWNRAVAAYNMGIGGAQKIDNHSEYGYVQEVKRKLETVVRQFNRNNGLQLTQRY